MEGKVKKIGILFHGLSVWNKRSFWVVVVDKDKKEEFLKNYTQTEWDKCEEVPVDFPEKYNT